LSFQEPTDTEQGSAESAPHILLVEDSAADIGLVREALQEHYVRCELTVIMNGELAVKFLDEIDAGKHPCPALFIIDLNLPRKPGKVVLERIRASRTCEKIPVIVLTSSDSQKDRDDVANLSPSRYIRKPSRLKDFVQLGALFRQILYPTS